MTALVETITIDFPIDMMLIVALPPVACAINCVLSYVASYLGRLDLPDNPCYCEGERPYPPCKPYPAGTQLNKTLHMMHDHGGCKQRTGSPMHWHYDQVNQNPKNCECFVNHHIFGGCGPPPPPFIEYHGPVGP